MSSLLPCSSPAWQAPVCEDQSVSQPVRRCDPARSQCDIVGALPSRSARTSTSWARPSISSSSSPGLSSSLPGAVRRALRSTTLRYQKPSSSIARAPVAAVFAIVRQIVITSAPPNDETCSPRFSSESPHTTAAFTSSTPNPSVSTVSGSATRSSSGHTSAFTRATRATTHKAAPKLFSVTPDTSSATIVRVTAETIHTTRIRPGAIPRPRRLRGSPGSSGRRCGSPGCRSGGSPDRACGRWPSTLLMRPRYALRRPRACSAPGARRVPGRAPRSPAPASRPARRTAGRGRRVVPGSPGATAP